MGWGFVVLAVLALVVAMSCARKSAEEGGTAERQPAHIEALGELPEYLPCEGGEVARDRFLDAAVITFVAAADCRSCNPHTQGIDSAVSMLPRDIHVFTIAHAGGEDAERLRRTHGGIARRMFCVDVAGVFHEQFAIERTPTSVVVGGGAVLLRESGGLASRTEVEDFAQRVRRVLPGGGPPTDADGVHATNAWPERDD